MTFKQGESGNPSGRPAGTKNKRTQLANLLEPYAEELIVKAVELARNGDVNALRLCLERLIPKATHEPVTLDFNFAEINNLDYLMEFGKAILSETSNGNITLTDAKKLSELADTHRRLIEHAEIKRMLDDIQRARKIGR